MPRRFLVTQKIVDPDERNPQPVEFDFQAISIRGVEAHTFYACQDLDLVRFPPDLDNRILLLKVRRGDPEIAKPERVKYRFNA